MSRNSGQISGQTFQILVGLKFRNHTMWSRSKPARNFFKAEREANRFKAEREANPIVSERERE